MSSLFSSPSKQATAAAQASQQISQQDIQQIQEYVDRKQGELQAAIGKVGPNPYFSAAQQINPQAYYTNPNNTVTYSNRGPGSVGGAASVTPSQPGPPNFPGVIMPAPKPPPTGSGGGGGNSGGGGTNPIGGGGDGPIINPITGRPIGGRQIDLAGNPIPIISPNGEPGSGLVQGPIPGQTRIIPPRELM